jgi:hypothetical protein
MGSNNMPVDQEIIRLGDDAAGRVYRQQQLLFLAVLGMYLCLSLRVASERLFWFDELFTFYTARLESVPALWDYLNTGSELNPPLVYLVSRVSLALLGENELALRFPAVIGYGVLVWCVYRFVGRRWGPLQGWLAALFLLASNITGYSYEARPYALALGCEGVALLCWQRVTLRATGRAPALAGLALSLGLAVSTHYYALLLFIPLGLAELVRCATDKRLDLPVGLALVAGCTPLLGFLPLIHHARTYSEGFWAQPTWDALEWSYWTYLSRLVLPLVLSLIVLAFSVGRVPAKSEQDEQLPQRPRPFEVTLLIALAALPALALLLGMLVTRVYTPRYCLYAVPGVAILFSFVVVRLTVGRPVSALLVIQLFFVWYIFVEHQAYCDVKVSAKRFADTCVFLRSHGCADAPVAYAEYHFFLQVSHYDPVLAPHAICVASLDLPLRHHGQNTDDRALTALARIVPLHVEEFEAFARAHGKFLLFGENAWMSKELLDRGARLTLVAECPDGKLFEVETYPAASLARRAGTPVHEGMASP